MFKYIVVYCITGVTMPVTTVRMADEELRILDDLAKRNSLDRSDLLKKALKLGVKDMLLEEALGKYQRGESSAWQCASEAGLTLWEFLDQLKKRDIYFRTDEIELEQALKEFQ